MHFKRMGNPCIGDLLIQKALEGKKVRIFGLEFTRGNIQTFSEANLGK